MFGTDRAGVLTNTYPSDGFNSLRRAQSPDKRDDRDGPGVGDISLPFEYRSLLLTLK